MNPPFKSRWLNFPASPRVRAAKTDRSLQVPPFVSSVGSQAWDEKKNASTESEAIGDGQGSLDAVPAHEVGDLWDGRLRRWVIASAEQILAVICSSCGQRSQEAGGVCSKCGRLW